MPIVLHASLRFFDIKYICLVAALGLIIFPFFFRLWTVCCAWLYRTIFAVLVVQRMHIYVDIWITLCVEWWCYCTVVALLLLAECCVTPNRTFESFCNNFIQTHNIHERRERIYINTTGRRGFIKCSSIINFVDYFYFFIFSIRLDGVVEGTDHVEDISTFEIPQNIYTETRSICVAV